MMFKLGKAKAAIDVSPYFGMHGAEWFTISNFQRFMHIVNSPDLIKSTSGIMEEIFQLDESKRFHLSLYVQEHVQSGKMGDKISIDLALKSKPEVKMASSEASKNELLRAMDLRVTTLSNELLTIFKKAAGALHSYKDISYLIEIARQFGAADLEHHLERFLELIQKSHIDIPASETYSRTCDSNDDVDSTAKNGQIPKAITPVKYGASPAKVAEIERQSSTESEESSCSSDEGKASAERSRALIRSATPRRSASPMKRIQIGRTGPRRAAAITVKSLNYFPSRERPLLHREISGNGLEEVSEQHKKTEIDVRRITVQDAINLFESKQRDGTADNETRRSLKDASLSSCKSILRRWSAGMGESPAECQLENSSEDSNPLVSRNVAVSEVSQISELKTTPDQASESHDGCKTNESFIVPQKQESEVYSAESLLESNLIQENEISKTKASLIEWNRQKEVELNQMLMKMMESKPVNKSGKLQPRKSQNLPREHRGGSYDSYKEKRNAKLPKEIAGKRAEKVAQCQGIQKMLNKRNAEMATENASVGKTNAARKPQKSVDSSKEASKSFGTRKVPSKPSSIPTVRKSWSTTPLPRETSVLPAKVRGGTSSAGSTPMRQKPQPKTKDPEISLKKEKPRTQQRNVKETQSDRVRSLKSLNEKQKPSVVSKCRISKETAAAPEGERPVPSKRSLPNKGTKKSSIVPLEPKPSVRKVSGTSNGASPVNKIKDSPKMGKSPSSINKIKDSPKLDKSLNNFENHVGDKQKEPVIFASDEINEHVVVDTVKLDHRDTTVEAESGVNGNKQCIELESLDNVNAEDVDMLEITEDSLSESKGEESTISPSAWVEIEERVGVRSPSRGGASQSLSPAYIAPVGVVSPRVRNSLSQMLQEESNEPDFCEWGNAENPPVIICQKDAPKGFKRLLKFARKSKGEANSSGRSSPSIFSEGEDDAEESKASSKRNAAFHTRNYGHYKSSLHEGSGQSIVQSNLSKYEGQHCQKMQETYDGVAGSTNKATRFFSLSAFRGNKPSERRLR